MLIQFFSITYCLFMPNRNLNLSVVLSWSAVIISLIVFFRHFIATSRSFLHDTVVKQHGSEIISSHQLNAVTISFVQQRDNCTDFSYIKIWNCLCYTGYWEWNCLCYTCYWEWNCLFYTGYWEWNCLWNTRVIEKRIVREARVVKTELSWSIN